MNIIKFLTLLLLAEINFATADYNPGLLFTGRVDHQPRTQLHLSPDKPLELPHEFTISFEASFHTHWIFGYLFNLVTDDGYRLSLTNQAWLAEDSVYFNLIQNREEKILSLPVLVEDLIPSKWHKFSITISKPNNRIELTIDEQTVFVDGISLPDLNYSDIIFGLDHQMGDVCHAAMREIIISSKQDTLHHWPLNEYKGEIAHNRINTAYPGKQSWGEWQSQTHSQWSKLDSIILDGLFNIIPDKDGKSLLFVNDTSMIQYDLKNNEMKTFDTNLDVPINSMSYYFDLVNEILYRQYRSRSKISQYNFDNQTWSYLDSSTYSSNYYGLRAITDDEGSLYGIGGYGWYSIKGRIQKYDFLQDKWDTLHVAGMENYHRNPLINLSGFHGNNLYLAGGQGNESGKQEFGYFHYYDLWKFNNHQMTGEKVWEDSTFSDSVQIRWIQIDENENDAIIITNKTGISEYRNYSVYGVNIKNHTKTHLFEFPVHKMDNIMFDKLHNRLVYYYPEIDSIRGNMTVYHSTINWPIMKRNIDIVPSRLNIYWVLIFILAIIIFIWVGKKRPSNDDEEQVQPGSFMPDEGSAKTLDVPCYFQLMDEFKIIINGKDIAHKKGFGLQSRRFFAYLILMSYQNKRWITMEKFGADFWEVGVASKITNRRTTLISRVRPFFKSLNEFPYLVKGDKISFNWNPSVYKCDLQIIGEVLSESKNGEAFKLGSMEKYKEALQLIGRGHLLPGINDDWVEHEREYLDVAVRKLMLKLGELFLENKIYEELTDLGKKMLERDQYDVKAIQFLYKGYEFSGQKVTAKRELKKFNLRYKSEIGEEPEMGILDSRLKNYQD